jgi:hypothetical protein
MMKTLPELAAEDVVAAVDAEKEMTMTNLMPALMPLKHLLSHFDVLFVKMANEDIDGVLRP